MHLRANKFQQSFLPFALPFSFRPLQQWCNPNRVGKVSPSRRTGVLQAEPVQTVTGDALLAESGNVLSGKYLLKLIEPPSKAAGSRSQTSPLKRHRPRRYTKFGKQYNTYDQETLQEMGESATLGSAYRECRGAGVPVSMYV